MRTRDLQIHKEFSFRFFGLLSTIILLSLFHSNPARAQTIQVELMASSTSWLDGEFTGHAFMCISVPVGSGIREDCFGFYPRGSGIVSGPGIVIPEIQRNPTRFSRVTVSIKKPISDEQRRQILGMLNDWNSRNYNLTNQSCIDFVNSVAQALGWVTPPRVATDLPETYLRKLADANDPFGRVVGTWTGNWRWTVPARQEPAPIPAETYEAPVRITIRREGQQLGGEFQLRDYPILTLENINLNGDQITFAVTDTWPGETTPYRIVFSMSLTNSNRTMSGTLTQSNRPNFVNSNATLTKN